MLWRHQCGPEKQGLQFGAANRVERVHWSLRVAPSDVIDAPLGIVLLSLSLDVVVQCGDELQ